MKRLLSTTLAVVVLSAAVLAAGSWFSTAFALGLDPAFPGPYAGPFHAKGVVVWSHGRSINAEDYKSPTPIYLEALRQDGWDVMRFDRLARGDTLEESTGRLADYAAALKRQGYKQVVLAGQSFGGFLALMAADASADVDAVVATAPAAYGNFDDFYDSWRLNATKLYPLLEHVKRARIMVFYFHDDDFDPGGRGERSREILAKRGLGYAVVDQPAYFTTHWAASSGLFLRRFGGCISRFADAAALSGEFDCAPRWGTMPSAELKLPPELSDPSREAVAAAAPAGAIGSGGAPSAGVAPHGVRDVWYGFYPNGREVLLGIEAVQGDKLTAVYAIGPSVDNKHPSSWSRRTGRIVDDSFVFKQKGKSTLRFEPKQDGGLGASWTSADGETAMEAHLKPIDPSALSSAPATTAASARAKRSAVKASAPISAAAANGHGDEPED